MLAYRLRGTTRMIHVLVALLLGVEKWDTFIVFVVKPELAAFVTASVLHLFIGPLVVVLAVAVATVPSL
jgi:hypothetical protein